MLSPENSRKITENVHQPRQFTLPDAVHCAIGELVQGATSEGAKTGRSEIVAALVHHAFTHMPDEELFAIWLEYRKADEHTLHERSPKFTS